jgi:hypothetical protein
LQPKDEQGLEREVPREVIQKGTKGKALCKIEEAENDPIGQPLCVIVVSRWLKGLEREVRRKTPSNEIGGGSSEGVDEVKEGEERDSTKKGVCLWYLNTLLQAYEYRILGQLETARDSLKAVASHGVRKLTSLSSWAM